jgi:hypothetical protein
MSDATKPIASETAPIASAPAPIASTAASTAMASETERTAPMSEAEPASEGGGTPATLDAPLPQADSTHSRVADIEATINKWLPVMEELALVAENASKEGHTVGGILTAVGKQLLGLFR